MLEGTLAALEAVENLEDAEAHLAWYKGQYLFLEVNAQDGYYLEFDGKDFHPEGGGQQLVTGRVERVGAEQWSNGIEGYVEIHPAGEPYQRIYLSGIQAGFVLPPDSLERMLRDKLHGHGMDRLNDELQDVGIRQL